MATKIHENVTITKLVHWKGWS